MASSDLAMASLERFPTPAPFVFGGSFSDYLCGGSKFRRFSTLVSLGDAVRSLDDSTNAMSEDPLVEDKAC